MRYVIAILAIIAALELVSNLGCTSKNAVNINKTYVYTTTIGPVFVQCRKQNDAACGLELEDCVITQTGQPVAGIECAHNVAKEEVNE